ncbi:MAG: transpeptidase involved in septal peptidoglycan synthesis (penicillin-binding protein 3) [uncultured bacterium (gcode 4)]|uniref:Transpeptidase involved in septal peptidoglycan synthesis (Penicillin-binding protein 3) n=1 Tax=uncultured bacterium (gcode 4) TaxID=1234023 RepID=K2FBB7_9BACT|nr:MAG: transpeptidase involved in septal peptidoglycan synthesis (penicillin-binding protein 3) [uncultured bacterium (gcode 4)]
MSYKKQLLDIYKKRVATKNKLLSRYLWNIDRIKIIFFVFILYWLIIISTSFKYWVMEYAYYSKLAEWQQTKVVKNSVNRWTIYSNNEPIWVLATSTDLSDLAVDPQQPWSKERLKNFLTEIIYSELCSLNQTEFCQDNLMAFLRVQEMEDFNEDPIFLKSKIHEEVKKRFDKKYIDFIIIKDGLDDDEKFKITSIWSDALVIKENSLIYDFSKNTDKTTLIEKLFPVIWMTQEALKDKLTLKEIRYIKFLTKLNLATKDKIDQRVLSEKNAMQKGLLDEKESINKFLILEPHPTRFYPEKILGSQVIWFVDNDGEGRYWIEWYFNEELKWQEWVKITKKDISWRAIWLYEQSEKNLVNGSDIKLTLDRNIQKEISRILEKWVKDFRANKWSVVVMDPKTWAIVAMAWYPDYDPNNYWDVYELERVNYSRYPNPSLDLLGMPVFVEDSTNWTEELKYWWKKIKLRYATEKELGNTAVPKFKFKNNFWPWVYTNDTISSLYEPGSVFKAITAAIGIDTWDIRPNDMYMDKWFVEIDTFKIKNISKECIGFHPYSHALDWSCNVWMIDIVKKIGSALFYKYINDFWFWQKTNITMEWEVFGKIQPYEKWSKAKLFTQSFWQWITATVLQMAAAYSALANWGIYMQPYIVDTITLQNWQVIKNTPTPLRRIIKEETSKQIIAMLTEWATIWFAKKWWVDGYDIAGKTGTSQIAAKGKYEEWWAWHTITSYGWFWPSSNPKFVMVLKLDRPRSAEFSETTSSALFSQISKYLLNYYAIPKSK